MKRAQTQSVWCLILGAFLTLASVPKAGADPYYIVTDLPNGKDPYPFPTSTVPWWNVMTPAEIYNLPGIYGTQGVAYPETRFFPMQPSDVNSQGTVIGGVPSGEDQANPYTSLTLGYAQKLPDGQYGSFQPLTQTDGTGMQYNSIFINSSNQILVSEEFDFKRFITLYNLNDHTVLSMSQIIPPDVLKQFYIFYGEGIDDNGDLLIMGERTDGSLEEMLLTPSGHPLPAPAPEPSAIITIVAGLGGLALRRYLRRAG